MRIESDHIYQHEEYEEVLVLGIHQRYESYDTERNAGVEDGAGSTYGIPTDGMGTGRCLERLSWIQSRNSLRLLERNFGSSPVSVKLNRCSLAE